MLQPLSYVNAPIEQPFNLIGLGLSLPPLVASVFAILVVKTYDILASSVIVAIVYGIYKKRPKAV